MIDNHAIVDPVTGMRIHLSLNGIFSYFKTRCLTSEEIDNWKNYPIVFITPDGNAWDPNAEHYVEQEAVMLDSKGLIVEREERPPKHIFSEGDIGMLYSELATWDEFNDTVDKVMADNDPFLGCPLTDDEQVKLNQDGIHAQLSSIDISHEPLIFLAAMSERAHMSHASMAMGRVSIDDSACDLFEANLSNMLTMAFATIAAVLAGKSKGISAEHLSKVWIIPHDDAARTLKVTTQRLHHYTDSSLFHNFGTNDRAVRYRKLKSYFFSDMLFVTGKAKSSRGNICAQLFVSDKGFVAIYPMQYQRDYFLVLRQFAKEVGVPEVLICDPHPTQTQHKVKEFCTQIGTTLKVLEAQTQWANRAELYVGLMKEATWNDMRVTGLPLVLWDYCMEWRALIFQITAKKLFQLNGTNPHTMTFGAYADISNLCQFGWYEWVYFRENSAKFPYQKERLGRCLGPAKNEGNEMAQWVLKDNGKIFPRRTLRRLFPAELSLTNETEAEKRMQFTTSIRGILGDLILLPAAPPPKPMDEYWELEPYGDDVESPLAFLEADLTDTAGKPFIANSLTDTLFNAEVLLPLEDSQAIARVVRGMVDSEGKLIGEHNDNPLLNTLVHECKFDDGTTKEYAANTIASNIFMESIVDGFSSSLLYHIIDHKSSGEAIKMVNKYITTKSRTQCLRQTTVGWKFLVKWANSSRQ